MKKILLTALILIVAAVYPQNTTWRGSVEVHSDYTVGTGEALYIEAGTTVRFALNARLIVYGEIRAMGTEGLPIMFVPLDKNDIYWPGVRIENSSQMNELNYVTFLKMQTPWESGNAGLTIVNSLASVSNCYFRNNYGDKGGAMKIVGGNVTVSNSKFLGNDSSQGGAIHVFNNSTDALSEINILDCRFENNFAGEGAAIYIQDKFDSQYNMHITISRSDFYYNYTSGPGGALYYNNQGRIDINFEKSKIFSNEAWQGSALYMKFREYSPGNILNQRFSNIIIFKNDTYDKGAVYIDMGDTQNPGNFKFLNVDVVFNSLMPYKSGKNLNTAGIYLKAAPGKFPVLRNCILWENREDINLKNFLLDDAGGQGINPDFVFNYCNLQEFFSEATNINVNPLYVRSPKPGDPIYFDIDKYDFHLSLLSGCVDAGDPSSPFINEPMPNGGRINIGAYGNTKEATRSSYENRTPMPGANVNVSGAVVLDFQGKFGTYDMLELIMDPGSELFIKSAQNANISFTSILTTQQSKFDGEFTRIQTLKDTPNGTTTPIQTFSVTGNVTLFNTDLSNVILKVANDITPTDVIISNSKFAQNEGSELNALEIVNGGNIIIENSKFVDYVSGIKIGSESGPVNKVKASGRIANNTVSFSAEGVSKNSKAVKQIGIEIASANIDVEQNSLEGGDEGIVMKGASSGRISNNTVSFSAEGVSKKGLYAKKGIVLSGNSRSDEMSHNTIINHDSQNTFEVTGIEIDGSKGSILYNSILFDTYGNGPRTGIRIVNPSGQVNVYNNTILHPDLGFSISSFQKVNMINNIYWSDIIGATTIAASDTANVKFYHNNFLNQLPLGIVGSGNISANPEITDEWAYIFTLEPTSPCINAGMVIEGIHTFSEGKLFSAVYYGSAPDIGSKEYYQELVAPSNITTGVAGGDFNFGWDAVPGFTYYKVYSSDDPFGTFTVAYHGTSLNYSDSVSAKKFYYVVATTEAPTKIYDSRPAVSENKTVAAPSDLREKAKQFRIDRQQKNR